MSVVVAGIDEVGYGPSLGPLVVGAYAFRCAAPGIDLWEALAPAVSRGPSASGLPVADSKELYAPVRGLGGLEPTALTFLAMLPELPGRSFRRLVERVSLGGGAALSSPWYADRDLRLPREADPDPAAAVALREALRRAGVVPALCRIAWVEPAEFNREVRGDRNKAELLFSKACALVREILASAPAEDAVIALGKQGGRRMYLPGLVREFGSVWVVEETPATSRYEFRHGGRKVALHFLRDGEDRDFSIALASMIGKYLREGAMRIFNDYWLSRRSDLRATSGYGADARRFFREIEREIESLRMDRDAVVRRR